MFGHGPTVYVQLMNSLRGYTNMVTDYNNARGHLNDLTDSGMQATPPYTDVLPGAGSADVYIVLAGSSEESVIDGAIGFMPCSSATAWGTVRAANAYGSGSESHTLDQKICLWPSRFSQTLTNGGNPNVRYQYLTLQHEMSHVLNLADSYGHSHAALMRNGLDMREINTAEKDAIRIHY